MKRAAEAAAVPADLAILGAKVWTVNPSQPRAEALAVVGERIAAVGSAAEVGRLIGRGTRVVEAGGRLVLPGFNDAHAHLLGGGLSLLGVDLRPARDEQALAAALRDHVAGLPRGQWITGGNWDHEAWPSRRLPARGLIDPVTPHHPVLLRRLDGHIALANSLALTRAGVGRQTPDPPGGRIVRDEEGEPTGILIDAAQLLVLRHVPEPDDQDWLRAAQAALRLAAGLGVTSVQSPEGVREFRILQQLRRRGELGARVYAILPFEQLGPLRDAGLEATFGDPLLRLGAVKIFADGSLGAGSALFFEPYDDRPDSTGLAIYGEDELAEMVRQVDAARLQAAVHAIGDKAAHWALNAFERARAAHGPRDSRHRIEHAQMVRPEDRRRFAPLGVLASIQPSHCIDDMRWVERRMGGRARYAYPFRSLLEAGAGVALGTDWHVEPLDPMVGLYAAATHEFPEGGPAGGWFPGEKVGIEQAVEAYTLGSARAEFQERQKGSLEPGKLADLVLLSRDVLTIPPQEILATRVDLTVLGGRVIHERPGASA